MLTRRRLLSVTANAIALSAVAGPYVTGMVYAQAEPAAAVNPDALAMLVYDIFPHEDIAPALYVDIARTIIAQEQGSEGDLELIRNGLQQLNELSGAEEWRLLDAGQRLQSLQQISGGEFFQSMLQKSRSLLYLRPEIWRLVGYGGNAMAQGGYLTRGFDDIEWLN